MQHNTDQSLTPTWEVIVRQINMETDSVKLRELARKLNDAMLREERERVKRRLGIAA